MRKPLFEEENQMKFAWFMSWLFIGLFIFSSLSLAKETDLDKMINFLVQKGVITQEEAATLLADMAVQKQVDKEKQKEFTLVAEKLIKVSGYTQFRYQTLYESGKIDGFDVRRARLTLKGDITPHISYKVQQEFGGGTPKLIDADMGFEYNHHLKFNFGQFKIPFSQENLASSNKFDLINRTQVVEALVARGKDVIGNQNGRDIGVMMSGSLWHSADNFIIDYAVGLFNGSGINGNDKDEQKDISGRLVFHPVIGLSLGSSFYYGGISNQLKKDYNRDRINAELAYDYQKFSFRGEYIKGKDGIIDKSTGAYKVKKDDTTSKSGYYVQVGYYVIAKVLQTVVRYDTFDPNTDHAKDALSVSTIGLNWSPNKWTKLQLNYEIKDEEGDSIRNNAVLAQMQVGF
jgi:phosphate-selective porin OprO and OprP